MTGIDLVGVALVVGLVQADESPIYRDATAKLGLAPANAASAWVDFDADGFVDLYAGGTLWMSQGGDRFTQGPSRGLGVFADFDNDGYPDLFDFKAQRMYRNQEGQGLVDFLLPELAPIESRAAAWGDFDGNGFVDLYCSGYEVWDTQTYPDRLLTNRGGSAFELTWEEPRFRARGVTTCDFDQDGDLDVYVSNYRLLPNLLLRNDGRGGFTDVAASHGALATSEGFGGGHSIGAAWGDFDGDGYFDLFAGNFAHVDSRGDQPKSRFLRNRGPEHDFAFEDRGTCGVFYQESYATPAAGDFDNDGDLDLYFTTVYGTASFGRKNHPVLFRNDGNWTFTDVTAAAGLAELPPTHQAAFADFDGDGDLDLATAGKVFENRGNENHWLRVRLDGAGASFNRSAVGAQVRIRLGGRVLARQVEAGTGEGNQNEFTLHFGLGTHADPVTVEVRWPDGAQGTVRVIGLDRLVVVPAAR